MKLLGTACGVIVIFSAFIVALENYLWAVGYLFTLCLINLLVIGQNDWRFVVKTKATTVESLKCASDNKNFRNLLE